MNSSCSLCILSALCVIAQLFRHTHVLWKNSLMKQIAIFASGAGSNAKKIIDYLKEKRNSLVRIGLIVCNKPDAEVLNIASQEQIPAIVVDKEKFFRGNGYVDELRSANIDFIVLAGFLWKVPDVLIKAYQGKMINIHPALLPKYGGKGMYGRLVHEAVIANKERESGITIHYVDEVYDNGQVILQATCIVSENDTPETLAKKVQALEHRHFPAAVAFLASL
jgi:phosphoribosylglycinamide formyltransferase-1